MDEGVVHAVLAEGIAVRLEVLRRPLLLHDFVVADDRIERTSQRLEDLSKCPQVRGQPVQPLAVDEISHAYHEITGRHDRLPLIASTTQRAFSLARL